MRSADLRDFLADHRGLLAAIGVAVVLRVALVALFPQMAMFGDELDYFRGARDLVEGREVGVWPFRPPLYLFLVSGVIEIAGPSADAVRLLQALLEGACVAFLYSLARDTGGTRAGLIAAWIYALYPDFVGYSHTLWSESFALALMLPGLWLLRRLAQRPSWAIAFSTGLRWGGLCLVKPYHVYLTPLLLASTVLCAPREARPSMLRFAAGALAAAIFVVAPWSVWISLRYEKPILISTTGGLNLRDGSNYYPPPQYDFPYPQRIPADLVRALGRSESLPAFIAGNPGLFVKRAGEKMGYLWSPNSFVIRHVYRGKYGSPQSLGAPLRIGVAIAVMSSTALLLLLAIPGFLASRDRLMAALTVSYVLPYTLMITITPALSRYRLPMMIFAILYAACFLARGSEGWTTLRQPRVWAPCLVVWTALAFAWSARVPQVVSALW